MTKKGSKKKKSSTDEIDDITVEKFRSPGSRLDGSLFEASSDEGFVRRMLDCARSVGSVSALAKKAGISQGGIRRYFEGGEPSRRALVAISRAAGVRIEWLATGEGPMTGEDHAPRIAPLDKQALTDVIEVVEGFLQERGLVLEPAKKAELLVLLYEDVREHEGKVDRARIIRLVKLAA